jgi:DNA-binding CsgD family transcriptional regulator
LLQYETLDGSQIKEIVQHGRLINPPPSGASPPGKKMPAENPLGSLGLTARETEVLNWIAQGKTNYEIGVILSACTGTICKHVERILSKLCVENRTAAAIALAALANAKNERSGAKMSLFVCHCERCPFDSPASAGSLRLNSAESRNLD